MNTVQLEQVLSNDLYIQRFGYYGVLPIDLATKLPKKYPSCFIINTHTSDKPGEHWIGIVRINKSLGYYFDSYGISPDLRPDAYQILNACSKWIFSKKAFQSLFSSTCGQYCCFFLLHATRGYAMEAIAYLLNGRSEAENDSFVYHYIISKYPHIKSLKHISPIAY